ncbi:hypothetical protein GCM10010145_12690 [Streptomyces ruber]|uniref:Uncharacterized protein n=2 Tax=Streptomyces TaxID=1883 RepID=A0A918B8K5_9ACTN|nr:hypothetical protein GCM10010145_12690 [Streptomyces ruber]
MKLSVTPRREASACRAAFDRASWTKLGLQLALLELHAEHPGHRLVLGDRVQPGHTDTPRVGDAQPLDALDGGGLARAVRAEDPEDLAFLDGAGDPVDDGAPPVGLAQLTDFDDRHAPSLPPGRGSAHRPSRSKAHQPIGRCRGSYVTARHRAPT